MTMRAVGSEIMLSNRVKLRTGYQILIWDFGVLILMDCEYLIRRDLQLWSIQRGTAIVRRHAESTCCKEEEILYLWQ